MNTKNIYIIRHGQTDYNKRGVVQGSGIDAPLNEVGRKQARAFHNTYKAIAFDGIYASDLQRTHQTLEPFVIKGFSLTKLSGFNEINWGIHEGKPMTPESDAYYANVVKKWRSGQVDLPIEGGESPVDVQRRVSEAMDRVMSISNESNVLICMHGRSMRILLSTLLGYPLSHMDIFPHRNTGCYHLIHTGNMYRVMKFNEHDHINGLA